MAAVLRVAGLAVLLLAAAAVSATELAVKETRFLVNGKPAFLMGISYYGALGASDRTVRSDLDALRRDGFNWIRVWATWTSGDENVSAVDSQGRAREPYLGRLRRLVRECDRRGMVVDVSLSRGKEFQGLAVHRRGVETLLAALKDRRNWYLDLSNERNIGDDRHTSFEDLKALRETVRRLDPKRLVTASQGGDISRDELAKYLDVGVDFITPHRPRDPDSPAATEARTRQYLAWMRELGRVVPVHYQEPFRRGYGSWEPRAEDFLADARGAIRGGAAGWCLHNGDERGSPDRRPGRSFDLREATLYQQLDEEERKAIRLLKELKR